MEEGPALLAGCPGPAAGWGEVALAMPVRLACTPAGLGWDLDLEEGLALSAGCPGPAAGWGEVACALPALLPGWDETTLHAVDGWLYGCVINRVCHFLSCSNAVHATPFASQQPGLGAFSHRVLP